MPTSRCSPASVNQLNPRDMGESYDIPPSAVPITYDVTRNCQRCSPAPSCVSPVSKEGGEDYDIPRPLQNQQNQLTPSSSASSLTADSLSSSNRSSVVNMPDYDVPKPHSKVHLVLHAQQVYDVPPASQPLRELPLELSSALEHLDR